MTQEFDVPAPPAVRSRRLVQTGHLVLGLIFLGLAGAWLLRTTGTLPADGLSWLVPLVLVVAGAAGLLAVVVNSTRQRRVRRVSSPHADGPR